MGNLVTPIESGITAHAGGGFADAYQLTKQYSIISVAATLGDSVVLPALIVGQRAGVRNDGANAIDVYPPGTGIDGGTPSAAKRLQPGHENWFTPIDATNYKSSNPATEAVSQATNISTGVTLDALKGIITTQPASAGASGATPNTFVVTNKFARSNSNISVGIVDFAGTGNPDVFVSARANGSFTIQLSSKSAAALNGIHNIRFGIEN